MWTARKGVRWLSRELRPQRDEVSVELVVTTGSNSFHSRRDNCSLSREEKKTKSHPCRGCKGGRVPQKAGIPGRWDPTAFQAAVRKWVRTGNSVQMVDPSNLKQY